MAMDADGEAKRKRQAEEDGTKVRALVRRVLHTGGTDRDAVEELAFFAISDPFTFTVSSDEDDRSILQWAISVELANLIRELLADGVLSSQENDRLRGALSALSGADQETLKEQFDAELQVAQARAGLLGSVASEVVPKAGVVVLRSTPAFLLDEKARTRFVAGHAGVSVPVGGM